MVLFKINMKLLTMPLLGVLLVGAVHAGQTESRLQSVEKLLETSSAAQQIRGSDLGSPW